MNALLGEPWAQMSDADRHVCPEKDRDAFKAHIDEIAKGLGMHVDWTSLVEFELRPVHKPRPKPPAYQPGTINNLVEFAEQVYEGVQDWRSMSENDLVNSIKRYVYKYTTCGAWFSVLRESKIARGVQVGSIVEGIDPTTETHTLMFPFEAQTFWNALDEVEKEAADLWDETHGCPDCWAGPKDREGWPINEDGHELVEWPVKKDCPSYGGSGRII